MIDPIDSLAFSISSNKNVYAILLGSGVSRAAEIPTGWDIQLDMIKRLAIIRGDGVILNPEEWYREKYKKDPNYSELLQELTKTKLERSTFLRRYFEPNDNERGYGKKLPTLAHQSIARLVAEGFINVIITTNFDKLLEKALDAIGITPVVISTRNQIIGAAPFSQNKCTILKVNGDYLDSRIKNIHDELYKYDRTTEKYLDKIFDEFGLIICGWSGEWDIALRDAIYRRKSRRYTFYWALHGETNDTINSIVSSQSAQIIKIIDADTFFSKLFVNVSAIDKYQSYHPLSKIIATSRVKKYIHEKDLISLRDFIYEETEILNKIIYEDDNLVNQGLSNDYFTIVESKIEIIHAIFCTCCYWGDESITPYLIDVIKRLIRNTEPYQENSIPEKLKLFPTLYLFYSGGIIALLREKHELLGKLLSINKRINANEEEPMLNRYNIVSIFTNFETKLPFYQNLSDPMSE